MNADNHFPENVQLRFAGPNDKRKIFDWAVHSNLSGEIFNTDHPAPSWEEFDEDYASYYFDGTQPLSGRCFIIVFQGEDIGQINYNSIDMHSHSTEIDIWLADRRYTCRGLGTQAILLLCQYLKKELNIRTIYMAPSAKNIYAVRAYRKAGFMDADEIPEWFRPDYPDVVMLRKML